MRKGPEDHNCLQSLSWGLGPRSPGLRRVFPTEPGCVRESGSQAPKVPPKNSNTWQKATGCLPALHLKTQIRPEAPESVSGPWHFPLFSFFLEVSKTLGHYLMAIYPAHQVVACLRGGPPLLWQTSLQGTPLVGHKWDDGGTRTGSCRVPSPAPCLEEI